MVELDRLDKDEKCLSVNFHKKGIKMTDNVISINKMTVLVTGAASGIGHALSLGFLGDGANVVAVDRQEEGLKDLKEKGAFTKVVDVSDSQQVEGMVKFALDQTGKLDVLVNNAGVAVGNLVESHQPDEWENVIRINLFGPYYGMKFAIPIMREQGFGRIINVVSRNAETGMALVSAYSSSKAGLYALTRCTAAEVYESNILVNGLIPGPTKTGMNPFGQQEAEVVYPTVKMMALFPKNGPSGKVFWDKKEYTLFQKENETYNFFARDPETKTMKILDLPDYSEQ